MRKAEQVGGELENQTIRKWNRVSKKEQGSNYNQACNTSYAPFWSSQHIGHLFASQDVLL